MDELQYLRPIGQFRSNLAEIGKQFCHKLILEKYYNVVVLRVTNVLLEDNKDISHQCSLQL